MSRPVGISQLLSFLSNHHQFVLLNNSFSSDRKNNEQKPFDFLVGIAGKKSRKANKIKEIDALLETARHEHKYVFGHVSYGLKDHVEKLNSRHADDFQWPLIQFFIPDIVIRIVGKEIFIEADNVSDCENIYRELQVENNLFPLNNDITNPIDLLPSVSKAAYSEKIASIKKHIQRGDIYEMNYCMEIKAENVSIDPYYIYHQISQQPAPFSCFYRDHDNFLLCNSPERFIKRTGDKIISQPIKGTARRGTNTTDDEKTKAGLLNSEKERAENVMIVDLVRNDLSRIAKRGTVKVEELFGIYSFPTVHQMISTISAKVKDDVLFSDIIRALFPMGSMTGAPKIRAMELIDDFENFNRGLYSGCIGYISPDGDFDFNVVIRSIIYNDEMKIISIPVGSAITAASDATAEYKECLLKAQGLLKSLGVLPTTVPAS